MKKIYLFTSLALSFVLIAASGGVGENQNRDRSGSPDGDNVCSQCHSAGALSPVVSLEITDADGNEVTDYIPEMTYMLSYTVSGTGSDVHGFQSTVLTDGNENAGTFVNPGTQVQFDTVTNDAVTDRAVAEQSSPSASGEFVTEWTAPAAGAGEITIYYSGVAANGNGSTSGDGYAGGSMTLTEDTEISIPSDEDIIDFDLTWNDQELILKSDQNLLLESLEIYSLTGQKVLKSNDVQLPFTINSSELSEGLNIIQVNSNTNSRTFKVMN